MAKRRVKNKNCSQKWQKQKIGKKKNAKFKKRWEKKEEIWPKKKKDKNGKKKSQK